MNKRESSEDEMIEDYLLALFAADNASPIKGRIMLVKQAFLLAMKVQPELARPMKFFPYLYGPYSNRVAEVINGFIEEGIVAVHSEKGDTVYELTSLGREEAEMRTHKLSEDIKKQIDRLKRVSQELGVKKLLKMVYRTYPQYLVHSRGAEIYGSA